MIVNLRKGQKYSKILKIVEKFNKILLKLQDIKIFKPISLSQETIQYHYFKL